MLAFGCASAAPSSCVASSLILAPVGAPLLVPAVAGRRVARAARRGLSRVSGRAAIVDLQSKCGVGARWRCPCYCGLQSCLQCVGGGDGAAMGICSHGVQFACDEDGPAIWMGSQDARLAGVGDGAAFVVCSQGDLALLSSRHVMSCRTCHVTSCRMWCRVACCRVAHVMSCRVTSGRVGSCRMSRHLTSCHVMSCRVVSCRVVSCHIASCRVMLVKRAAAALATKALLRCTRLTLSSRALTPLMFTHSLYHSHSHHPLRSRSSVVHLRRLPTHVFRLNFTCGVIQNFFFGQA